MNSGDRYFDPKNPGVNESAVDLYAPLSKEEYSKSTIRLLVDKFEIFMEHQDVALHCSGGKIANSRRAVQQMALDAKGAFLQEVYVEYDYDSRNLVEERYAVTFTVASHESNEQKSHALITIFRNNEVTMLVSDYDIAYYDEKVIKMNNEHMRPATEYDVEALYDLMIEVLELQHQQDSYL